MDILDDDCIAMIYQQLELKDQMCLAMTCERLADVYKLLAVTKLKQLDMRQLQDVSPMHLRNFFGLFGSYVRSIKCKDFRADMILEVFIQKCGNLESVSLNLSKLTARTAELIAENLRHLKYFSLYFTTIEQDAYAHFARMSQLEYFALHHCNCDEWQSVQLLPQGLREFHYFPCKEIEHIGFEKACQENFTNLRSLTMFFSTHYGPDRVACLLMHLNNLETLRVVMTNPLACEGLAKLPNLKHLEIADTDMPSSMDLIQALRQYKSQQLLSLKIFILNRAGLEGFVDAIGDLKALRVLDLGYDDNLSDKDLARLSGLKNLEEIHFEYCEIGGSGVLNLLENCPKLSVINMQGCSNVGEAFLLRAVELLKQKKQVGNSKLTMYLRDTGVDENDLETHALLKTNEIWSLNFDHPPRDFFKNETFYSKFSDDISSEGSL